MGAIPPKKAKAGRLIQLLLQKPVTKLNIQANEKHTAINDKMYGKNAMTTPIKIISNTMVKNAVMMLTS